MASTYSSLKIQLMGTGENSGTWGTITNTNLGTALEEAIVGSADVNFSSADVTLTLTDSNSSQSARNLRLNLTGSVGAPQNLIVPAIEKVYIVNNGLTQTITVKNASGTGISVPPGKTEFVYNNGTSVVDAINHLTSLTLDTPLPVSSGGTGSNTGINASTSVTGILPVANGGTGSNSATFSGANITSLNASSISSGTIANTRTTASDANGASTIVARDASGNFSANVITANGSALTSLNASNVSSGTLAVARGGTGTGTPSLVAGTNITVSGTWPNQTVAASGGGPTGQTGQAFTSSGTFTIPAGVTAVKVTVTGAGGSPRWASGCCGFNGVAGGTSSVSSGTQSISTISATGGGGATSNVNAPGGVGSGGNINIRGGTGSGPNTGTVLGGGSFWAGPVQDNAGDAYGAGQGGGAGGTAIRWLTGLTSGNTLSVTVAPAPNGGGRIGNAGLVVFEW